jgi:hypothetical protein
MQPPQVSVSLAGYGKRDKHCHGNNGSSRNLKNNLEQGKDR